MISRKMVLSLLAVTVLLFTAAGCVSPFSKEVRQRIDKGISFEDLLANPENYRGQVVMLGGRILMIKPKKGHTEMTILQQPLSLDYSPVSGDRSGGRFLLIVKGFLDPAVYSPGRRITTAAEVTGTEERSLGEKTYTYPVLNALQVKLWPPPPKGYQYWDPLWGPPRGPFLEPHPIPHPPPHRIR